ncbi:hypothetical protein BH23PLA1_BH23PLA1_34480 [soil metagenome]
MISPLDRFRGWTARRMAWSLAVLAALAVVLTLGDPGITVDEPIDVKVGRNYVAQVPELAGRVVTEGASALDRRAIDALFADNAQHPPLGRWLVGLASTLAEPFEAFLGGADPLSVHPARLAPALAFAVLVGVVSGFAGRRYGRGAGLVSGLALLMMPRVFAHAHFATLDTFLALSWTLALLGANRALGHRYPMRASVLAGLLWGLALLVKIHAWLLPPLVLAVALARLRPGRALVAVLIWASAGLAVFFAGWPWLWFDTVDRLRGYLSTSVVRMPLRVEYFGTVYLDREVPWHYPWVYFALTVPVGLHLLGVFGAVRGFLRRRVDPLPMVLVGSIGLFLLLFSTGAPVYDGERLFLHVFPAWAILIGLGFHAAWERFRHRWLRFAMVAGVLAQGYGTLAMHPFGMSYYNGLVGGLWGAEKLGLEPTYWGDAIDPVLLAKLARHAEPGAVAILAPSLHHLQPTAAMTEDLFDRHILIGAAASAADRAAIADAKRAERAAIVPMALYQRLATALPEDQRPRLLAVIPGAAGEPSAVLEADWVLIYRRSAYWDDLIRQWTARPNPVAQRQRQGVWISRFVRLPAIAASELDGRENPFRTN